MNKQTKENISKRKRFNKHELKERKKEREKETVNAGDWERQHHKKRIISNSSTKLSIDAEQQILQYFSCRLISICRVEIHALDFFTVRFFACITSWRCTFFVGRHRISMFSVRSRSPGPFEHHRTTFELLNSRINFWIRRQSKVIYQSGKIQIEWTHARSFNLNLDFILRNLYRVW